MGTVVDSSLAPLGGVEVRWYYSDPNEPIITITTTDQQGNYNFTYSTRAALQKAQVYFYKAGYTVVVAEPYTVSEAGRDICGSITLRRDAIMQPQ